MITSIKYKSLARYTLLRWVAALLTTGLILSLLLFYLPIGRAYLNIDVDSKMVGDSQVFFGVDSAYTQTDSSWRHITPGRSKLSFPLKGFYTSVRWDPLDGAGAIQVTDIYISAFGKKLDLDKIALIPLLDIEHVKEQGGLTSITTTMNARDPQFNVVLDFKKVYKDRILISGCIGFSIALLLIFLLFFKSILITCLSSIEHAIERTLNHLRNDGFNIKEVGYLIAIGSVCYVYFLSTFSFSIDDEMAAVRQDPAAWVSQGRWFVYLVEKFIFPQSSIPFAPYALLVISISVSYVFILRAHNLTSNWKTYTLYPIFCAFPTWWFISEFYSNVPSLAFGILFISVSAYLSFNITHTHLTRITNKWTERSLMILMLACAMAAYQSLILFFICLTFGILLVRSLQNNDSAGAVLRVSAVKIFDTLLTVLLSLALYSVLNTAAQKLLSGDSGYIANFINYEAFFDQPLSVISLVINEMGNIYFGDAIRYGTSIGLSALIIILATVNIVTRNISRTFVNLILWAGVLATPFALNFISGGLPLPMRTMLAVAYVSWLATLVILSSKRKIILAVATVIIGIYEVQIFSVTSQYMVSATVTQAHDRILAADIYRRIGELSEDFDRTAPTEVDIFGRKPISTLYANGWSSTMQGSFFSWDDGNIDRMLLYMKIMGYENISAPSNEQRVALTPEFKGMPVWPAAGSVKKVGNQYLVRLSKEADPTHARFSH